MKEHHQYEREFREILVKALDEDINCTFPVTAGKDEIYKKRLDLVLSLLKPDETGLPDDSTIDLKKLLSEIKRTYIIERSKLQVLSTISIVLTVFALFISWLIPMSISSSLNTSEEILVLLFAIAVVPALFGLARKIMVDESLKKQLACLLKSVNDKIPWY